jgi:hypothetical protein
MSTVLLNEPNDSSLPVFRPLDCRNFNGHWANCLNRKGCGELSRMRPKCSGERFGLGIDSRCSPVARMGHQSPPKMMLAAISLWVWKYARPQQCQPQHAVLNAASVDGVIQYR